MILQPQEYFTIVRQLGDPNDANTYYVRAVIRNARTDAIVTTLSLTDQGSRRFSLPWQVSADPSGQGFYISVLTSVYTDSGYTTKSDVYSEEMETYLIDNRFRNLGGGGGGDGVDYKKLRAIFEDVLTQVFFKKDGSFKFLPDFTAVIKTINSFGLSDLKTFFTESTEKLNTVSKKIDFVKDDTSAIDTLIKREPTEVDLRPVFAAIEANKPEEVKETDFAPVLTVLEEIKNTITTSKDKETIMALSKGLYDLAIVVAQQATKEKAEAETEPAPPDYLSEATKIINNSVKNHA